MKGKLYRMIQAGWRGKDFGKAIRAQSQNMSWEEYEEFYPRAVAAYEFGRENADEYARMEEAFFDDEFEDFSGLLAREEEVINV